MPLPLQIVFHQLDPWPGAEAVLRERAQRLERLCPEMMSCRVVVEETQKHQQLGRPVAVRVEVHVPGHALTVNRQHDTDFKVAAREAFEAMTRRLEDLARRRREQGWEHGAPRTGQVLVDSQERVAEALQPLDEDTQPSKATP
jgi:ribosome-associated translation inhibitor RaiA